WVAIAFAFLPAPKTSAVETRAPAHAAVDTASAAAAVEAISEKEKPPIEPAPSRSAPRHEASTGTLSVEVNVPAIVSLGGARLGSAPLRHVAVHTGTHLLVVENAALGIRRRMRTVVRPGKETTVDVRFENGTLHVSTTPWADVWLDGAKIG